MIFNDHDPMDGMVGMTDDEIEASRLAWLEHLARLSTTNPTDDSR